MPPRKIWTGSINFGLVTIPVGLYAATENHTIQFHQFERGTSDRVRYKRVNERTGQELGYDDIVKGREQGGAVITVEPSELDEIAPARSRTIDITSFVDLSEIDPVHFQKTYWLAPNSKEQSRPYNLLRAAMRETNRAGIAQFVLRGKEYLTAVRADEGVLALNTLFFADEIRDPADVAPDTEQAAPSDKELQMATTVIDSMSETWQPERYEDTYTAEVEQLVEQKAAGQQPEAAEAPPEPSDVIDLTEALQRSVEQARGSRSQRSSASSGGGRSQERAHHRSPDRSGGGGDEQLTDMNKAQLEDRAKQLGIRGRSKMNRAALEKAVEAASHGSRRRSKAS